MGRCNFRKERFLLHWANQVETIEVFRWSDNYCKEHRLRGIMLFRDVVLSSPATKSGNNSQELILILDFFFFLSFCALNVDRSFLKGLWSSSGRKVQYSLLWLLLTSVTGSSVYLSICDHQTTIGLWGFSSCYFSSTSYLSCSPQ